MFDLITGKEPHIPGGGAAPVLMSTALHLLALGAVVTIPLLLMRDVLPEVPTMMAFVASAPAPPPPPPPPPPAAPAPQSSKAPTPRAAPVASPAVAPVEAPSAVTPERAVAAAEAALEGGVEGGVPGGVIGGVVGGLPDSPPPPPPPAPAAPTSPIRLGGQIEPPTLTRRVEPVYPAMAAAAQVQGVVILEATVSADGRVQDVRVLRSVPLLDRSAVEAVMQWRYSPVLLNGKPVPFILTVVISFTVPDPRKASGYSRDS